MSDETLIQELRVIAGRLRMGDGYPTGIVRISLGECRYTSLQSGTSVTTLELAAAALEAAQQECASANARFCEWHRGTYHTSGCVVCGLQKTAAEREVLKVEVEAAQQEKEAIFERAQKWVDVANGTIHHPDCDEGWRCLTCQVEAAQQENKALVECADSWAMVADGVRHDPRCGENAWICLRCQVAAAQQREQAIRALIAELRTNPYRNVWAIATSERLEAILDEAVTTPHQEPA